MGFWETVLTTVLIAIVVPSFFALILLLKSREEKKIKFENTVRTRPPKIISGFFLGFALLVLLGGVGMMIYCCITDAEHTTVDTVIVASVCIALFSALGFFGYAYARFNYVVANDEGVLAYRLFRKSKFYRYEDIGSFQDTINLGMMGALTGYGKDGKKIFAIEAVHIGSSEVARLLREHGVSEKDKSQTDDKNTV